MTTVAAATTTVTSVTAAAMVPCEEADFGDLAFEACQFPATHAGLRFGPLAFSPGVLSRAFFEGSSAAFAVQHGACRVALGSLSDWHPRDGVATLRLFPLAASEAVEPSELEALVTALNDEVASRFGLRKLVHRFPATTGGRETLFRAIRTCTEVEGFLESFWWAGDRRHGDAIFAHHRRPVAASQFVLLDPLFGAPHPVPELPSSAWRSTRFPDAPIERWTRLSDLAESDLMPLYGIETDRRMSGWLFSGSAPSFPQFADLVVRGVAFQKVVRSSKGELLGRITLYDVSESFHYGKIAIVLRPDAWASGWPMEAMLEFLRLVFNSTPIEVVSFETSALSPPSAVKALARVARLAAHLAEDRLLDGTPFDRYVFTLHRAEALRLPLLRRIGGTAR